MPLNIGQVLKERYHIEALLGQGGMGAVYRGTDLSFDAPVAIKENRMISPESQRQFGREASLLYRLRHPNLPRVIDHFLVPGQGQYLVMDYVEGEDLKQILDRRGALAEAQALSWIRQILDALAYLHSQQIIHRDIKPANIRITPQGQALLVDFGIAKVHDPVLRTTTAAQAVTPGFAPPEQYGQGRTDARSDLYSVGATLYTALTGQPPPDALERMVHKARLLPPRQLNPQVSPETESAVLRALQLRADDRFPSASAFRAALAGSPTTPPRREQAPSSSWLWLMVGGAAVLVLAMAIAVGMLLFGGRGPEGGNLPPATVLASTEAAPASVTPVSTTVATLETPVSLPEPGETATPPLSPPPSHQALPPAATEAGEPWTRTIDGMVMAYVPAGEFLMGFAGGRQDEQPEHTVYLDAFWIDRYEVTNRQFGRFVDETGYKTTAEKEGSSHVWTGYNTWVKMPGADWQHPAGPGSTASGLDDHPVVAVSWYDAQAYCRWVGGRLPTEAEWEKAARGTEGRHWPWGDSWSCAAGNFDDETTLDPATTGCRDGYARTAPVGTYPQGTSPYGVYDLAGNVSEWVADWYDAGYYARSTADNPVGPSTGTERALRGGGWFTTDRVHGSARRQASPSERVETIGFRCVAAAAP